jgi:hypothetical protein
MVKYIWNRVYSFLSPEVRRNLGLPAERADIYHLNELLRSWGKHMDKDSYNRKYIEKYGSCMISLPLDLCYSLSIHNGEDNPSGIILGGVYSEHGIGCVLGYARLLSIEEIIIELKLQWKAGLQSFCFMDGLCLIPITTKSGGFQLCVNVMKNVYEQRNNTNFRFGEIYLVSGWNILKKANSWLQYMYGLMDTALHTVQFPVVL